MIDRVRIQRVQREKGPRAVEQIIVGVLGEEIREAVVLNEEEEQDVTAVERLTTRSRSSSTRRTCLSHSTSSGGFRACTRPNSGANLTGSPTESERSDVSKNTPSVLMSRVIPLPSSSLTGPVIRKRSALRLSASLDSTLPHRLRIMCLQNGTWCDGEQFHKRYSFRQTFDRLQTHLSNDREAGWATFRPFSWAKTMSASRPSIWSFS